MEHKNHSEHGRSLLETVSVLVVIAILLIASLLGYRVVLHQWKKNQTVKQATEVAVRYRLRPILADKNDKKVSMKTLYPEGDRIDAYQVKTADEGRLHLEVPQETSSFMVIVNEVLDDSCEAILENGGYDAVLWKEGEAEFDAKKEYITIGSKLLKDWKTDGLPAELKGKTKEEVIAYICNNGKGKTRGGRTGTMSLSFGDKCPQMSAGHWYEGKCWKCAQNEKEDKAGVCCAKDKINSCGYCQEKTSASTYCIENPNVAICHTRLICNAKTTSCVECIVNEHCCGANAGKECSNGHCCLPGLEWNGKECACPSGKEMCNAQCCETGEYCVTNGENKTCCKNTGGNMTICTDNNCCMSGNCSNGYCCPSDEEYVPESKMCCTENRMYMHEGKKLCCSVDLVEGYCPDQCTGCYFGGECFANNDIVGGEEGCGRCQEKVIVSDASLLNVCEKCSGPSGDWLKELKEEGKSVVCGEKCCGTAEHCVAKTEEKKYCCANKGDVGSACSTDLCCSGTLGCKNGHCCPSGKYWNETAKACTSCVANYGSGKTGECPTSAEPICPTSGENAWTCQKCPDATPYWNDEKCVACLRNNGEEGDGACPTENPLCNNEGETAPWTCEPCPAATPVWDGEKCVECVKHTDCEGKINCNLAENVCCPSTEPYWNEAKCVRCLADYSSDKEGACVSIENPKCDNEGTDAPWICTPCPEDKPYWNGTKCVCLVNYGAGDVGACPQGMPVCDKSGTEAVCKVCPAGTFWNNTTKTCTECLVNYGKGTGACKTKEKPLCDNEEGEEAPWECIPCEGGMEWNGVECACPASNPVLVPAAEGEEEEELCCPSSAYVASSGHCCLASTPIISDKDECCAKDGSNSESCCLSIMGTGYEWKDGKCVPKCPEDMWAESENSGKGECCKPGFHVSEGHCCEENTSYYPYNGEISGRCCKSDKDSLECCVLQHGKEYELVTVKNTKQCLKKCDACKKRNSYSGQCVVDSAVASSDKECCEAAGREWNPKKNTCCVNGQSYAEKSGRCCDRVINGECFAEASNGLCYIGSNGQGRLLSCSNPKVVSGEFCIGNTNFSCGSNAVNVRNGEPCGCDSYLPLSSIKGLFIYDKHNHNWCTAFSGRHKTSVCQMCGKDSHHKKKHVKSHYSLCRKR